VLLATQTKALSTRDKKRMFRIQRPQVAAAKEMSLGELRKNYTKVRRKAVR
jgi:hypothetical protein